MLSIDIEEYLTSKGCEVKRAGSGNIKTRCFFHGEPEGKPGRLYIKAEEGDEKFGVYWCHRCNAKGNLNQIRKHFGDEPIEFEFNDGIYNPMYEAAAEYYHQKLFENFDAYMYLEDRGITEEAMTQFRIGWADGGLSTHLLSLGYLPEDIRNSGLVRINQSDYFKNQIIFPYMEDGAVVDLRGKEIGGKTYSMSGTKVRPYNIDSICGEQTAYLVEGEIDCITLQQFGFNTVGLPGVHTFKEDWVDYFEDAKRIYIIFDQDSAGRSGAEKVSGILGQRSRIVELPKKGIDINDFVVKLGKTKDDFDYLFSKAKGGLLVSVDQAYEKWTLVEGNPTLAGRRFNIPEIDRAMTFGMLPGQVVTLLARSNAGKTMMTINLMHRMRMADPDIKILYLSLEQTSNEWYERAHRIHNFYEPGSTTQDTINYWADNLMMVEKNRITEEQVIDCLDQYAYEMGRVPDILVVDYTGYYAKSFPGRDERERVSAAIMGLKAISKEYGLITLAPHQANRTGDLGGRLSMDMAKDSATVEETSDLFISMWNPDQRSDNLDEEGRPMERKGILWMEIQKARDSGVGTLVKFHFAPLTLAIVSSEDPMADRAIGERLLQAQNHSWREAVDRYLTGSKEL